MPPSGQAQFNPKARPFGISAKTWAKWCTEVLPELNTLPTDGRTYSPLEIRRYIRDFEAWRA